MVGRELLRQLMADPTVGEVRALMRRPMSRGELLGRSGHRPGDERLQVCEVDFDRLDRHVALFEVDWVCCAMGTTIRKAGSQAAFRQVDFDYPFHMAQLACAQGAHQLMLVSALGADAGLVCSTTASKASWKTPWPSWITAAFAWRGRLCWPVSEVSFAWPSVWAWRWAG